MRYLTVIIAVLAFFAGAFAAEINIGLDRCVILNDSTDISTPTKVALSFTLPDSLMDREIVYAELRGWLSLHHNGSDSLFELRFYPILGDWSEGQYDYQNIEAITDSLSVGLYTIRQGDSSAFHVDLTGFVMQLAQSERTNYGLIGTADLIGDANLRLPERLGARLRDLLRIRIIYK
jgi:hypothetical protein